MLEEYCMKVGLGKPDYKLHSAVGQNGRQLFLYRVRLSTYSKLRMNCNVIVYVLAGGTPLVGQQVAGGLAAAGPVQPQPQPASQPVHPYQIVYLSWTGKRSGSGLCPIRT